jgi:hypothetical protein
MLTSILSETTLSLSQAARIIPPYRLDRPVHPATLTRWILSGVRGPDGSRIRLEAIRRPSGWLTSREAVERFLTRLTPDLDTEPALRPETPGKRHRACEQAGRELEKLGI